MRYASIRSLDTSNGSSIGCSIFVQFCPFHCKNCFNPQTWSEDGGKEWTEETKKKFLEIVGKPYIKRVSILGGEPLASQNLEGVLDLVNEIRLSFPEKTIWLYTGYCWEDIFEYKNPYVMRIDYRETCKADLDNLFRRTIIKNVDVLVDGRYEEDKRDITKKWCGSTNQRVIDVAQSLAQNNIVLYCE